ncbi:MULTISPECIES: hypothetical protein [unclassified Bradyrhizobium]|uniref:hypothetical protein n=1 Tax=Bradyrhizobium sp. USDA 4541 TaxID=2817704 RepID=UPI0020A529CC|nr:hypothetical protein [Bradyrhizobium sp. USDA 4541]MCP1846815.1 gamma-glutamyl-gamma-aminobutyrate hydrolase PuuD [Bradyrhizobium sp. USDA 4541]
MLSSDPAFSDANLKEIAVDISLEVSWAVLQIFRAHGIGTFEVGTFHKSALKAVGKKLFTLAEANFDGWFE